MATRPPDYIKSTGESSAKYGPCEVCSCHVSDMHLRRIEGSHYVFGHKACLERPAQDVLDAAARFRISHHGAPAD